MNFSSITLYHDRVRIVVLRRFDLKQMLKLIVRSLVCVIEVCRVERVRPREGVVDLRLLGLGLASLSSLFVTLDKTELVVVIVVVFILALHVVIVTAEVIGMNSAEAILVEVSRVQLLITLDKLIHLLLRVVEACSCASLASLRGGLPHVLLKHHDLILLVRVLVLVVGIHVEPRVRKHLLSCSTLVRIPR